jgi:hypothetical protein
VQIVCYADDINLIGRSLISVEEIIEAVEMERKEVGLKINAQKTKVLIQSKERRYTEWKISIGNVKLEVASNFTYLGTHLTNKNEELEEIQSRIQAVNRAYFSTLPLIKSHGISWRVRVTLYKTLICSILMYGSVVWTPKEPQIRSIPLNGKSFERYLEPPSPKGCGELGTMIKMYKDVALSTYMHLKRMWAGHIVRMEHHIPKKVLGSCFGG